MHVGLIGSATSLATGSFVFKTMASDIPLWCVMDLDYTIFLPVRSAMCPFHSGNIFVHSILKGTFLHGIIDGEKACVPSVLRPPPRPTISW